MESRRAYPCLLKNLKFLKKMDVNVPTIYSENEALGLILVEDFGDELYQFNLSNEKADLYYDLAIE
jgi:aminoglycoside/choline kinase family phosphotransferase